MHLQSAGVCCDCCDVVTVVMLWLLWCCDCCDVVTVVMLWLFDVVTVVMLWLLWCCDCCDVVTVVMLWLLWCCDCWCCDCIVSQECDSVTSALSRDWGMSLSVLHCSWHAYFSLDSLSGSYFTVNLSSFPRDWDSLSVGSVYYFNTWPISCFDCHLFYASYILLHLFILFVLS